MHLQNLLKKYPLYYALVAILLCGCATGMPGAARQGPIDEQQFLSGGDLRQQAVSLKKKITQDPTNAVLNFSYGRVLLATNQSRQALPFLEKAVSLDPDNAEYLFWLGVGYGEMKKTFQERASYQRALQHDSRHVQALVYLGNNYLNGKVYQPALNCYQRALEIDPENSQALYNRAMIFKLLQRTPEEILAWRLYLEAYPSGLLARKAADHLNLLEDFSYRNHYIGPRILTLPALSFMPFSEELTPSAREALDRVGTAAGNLKKGSLDILVYQKNNRELARKRALSIKRYLDERFETLNIGNRIRLSWFDLPEKRKIGGRFISSDESVVFFLADLPTKKIIKAKKKGKKE